MLTDEASPLFLLTGGFFVVPLNNEWVEYEQELEQRMAAIQRAAAPVEKFQDESAQERISAASHQARLQAALVTNGCSRKLLLGLGPDRMRVACRMKDHDDAFVDLVENTAVERDC